MDLKKTGRLIMKKRKELNLTQEQLSEKLFVTPQAISLWDKGQRFPDPDAQVMIYKVLDLNPVELLTGLEMYDEAGRKSVSRHMRRIDEEVTVAGDYVDDDGFEEYFDFSDYMIPLKGEKGELGEKWVSFTDYYNVEKPSERPKEDMPPKTDYDPAKVYLNQGHDILVLSTELLERIGKPQYFSIRLDEEGMRIFVVGEDEMSADRFDIPEKVYNGNWKGIRVFGGDFSTIVLKLMGIKRRSERLEAIPVVSPGQRAIMICLDEVKRSGTELESGQFLLPQWQYEELIADMDDFESEDDEED